jgi:uncharacterized RDD family membrane protein YckC
MMGQARMSATLALREGKRDSGRSAARVTAHEVDAGSESGAGDQAVLSPKIGAPESDGALWSVFAAVGRLMLRPVRVVGGSSGLDVPRRVEDAAIDAVATPAAERALDEIFAGPLPEMVGRALGEHRVVERIVAEAVARDDLGRAVVSALESERTNRLLQDVLASRALEQLLSEVLESRRTVELTDRVLRSTELEQLLGHVVASKQLRRALAKQSTSLAGEAAAAAHTRAVRFDAAAERWPRRWLRRPASAAATPYAGIGTRGLALAIDAALTAVVVLALGALGAAVASLVGGLRPAWVAGLLLGAGWLVVEIVYFVGFWSTVGQTPGMRLMRLQVVGPSSRPPGFLRSLVRLAALAIAIIPCFAGFLPALVDGRRRALPDFVAGTVVMYDDPVTTARPR